MGNSTNVIKNIGLVLMTALKYWICISMLMLGMFLIALGVYVD